MEANNFIRLTVHEMKAPITTIHGYTNLLRCGIIKDEVEYNTALSRIEAEAMRASRLIEEMGVYAGVKNDTVYTAMEDICLTDVLSNIVAAVKARFSGDDIDIAVSGDAVVKGDEELFMQLLTHLIENGIIYNESPSKKITCTIKAEVEGLTLDIEDNGIGISEGERERVPECFYCIDKDKSKAMGGNGMGLAICRAIADRYNGVLTIGASAYGGTRVTVKMPVPYGNIEGNGEENGKTV